MGYVLVAIILLGLMASSDRKKKIAGVLTFLAGVLVLTSAPIIGIVLILIGLGLLSN